MQATPDGDGSLLDHSLIMYGSGMGNGNLHRHSDLPVLLAGKLGGKFKTGYHLDYKMDTPMANLLVTILDQRGRADRKAGRQHGTVEGGSAFRIGDRYVIRGDVYCRQAAIAAGAAALRRAKPALRRDPPRRKNLPGNTFFPPAFATRGSRPRAPKSTR